MPLVSYSFDDCEAPQRICISLVQHYTEKLSATTVLHLLSNESPNAQITAVAACMASGPRLRILAADESNI